MSTPSANTRTRPLLEIVSDVVCPWCYVGKARLARALALAGDSLDLEIRWRPFELNPSVPREGIDRRAYVEAKFGSVEYARQLTARVVDAAAAEGLPMHYDRIKRTPNTRSAHRLLELAGEQGRQDAVVDALFAAYFVEGRDIGDHAVLIDIATAAGLDREATARTLADTAGDMAIEQAEAAARESGVDSVPAFVFNGRLLFSGAQSPETIAAALTRAVARGL